MFRKFKILDNTPQISYTARLVVICEQSSIIVIKAATVFQHSEWKNVNIILYFPLQLCNHLLLNQVSMLIEALLPVFGKLS